MAPRGSLAPGASLPSLGGGGQRAWAEIRCRHSFQSLPYSASCGVRQPTSLSMPWFPHRNSTWPSHRWLEEFSSLISWRESCGSSRGTPGSPRWGSVLTCTHSALRPAGKHTHTCMHKHVHTHTLSSARRHTHLHVPTYPAWTPRPSGSACSLPPHVGCTRLSSPSLTRTGSLAFHAQVPRHTSELARAFLWPRFLPSAPFLGACFWSSCLLRVSPRPKGSDSFRNTGAGLGPSFLLSPPGPQWGSPQAEVTPVRSPPVSCAERALAC